MDFPITNDIYILKISNYFENIANSFQKQERLLLSDEEKQKRIQNITQKFMNK
ncbi:hypothetical protein FACS1894176_07910 [Bacteroidia bacterium]|nr:hypothetical protein FACS1894176_07910 [Bacteroidia bacterium]